jgi:TrmH family RNA methyltransferase
MTVLRITSRDNPLYKQARKLAESRRARALAQQTLLDGEHLLAAYLDAGGVPDYVFLRESAAAGDLPGDERAAPDGRRQVWLAAPLFDALSPVATPTGVLALVPWLVPVASPGTALWVLAENVQDPGNLGALLRSAAAAGATLAVLGPGCADPWSPKALRGGQGAQFSLPVAHSVDPLAMAEAAGVTVAALAMAGTTRLYDFDWTRACALLVGNEGAGLSADSLARAAACVSIPMPGRMESLNVTVAAGIALFEAVRQRSVR